MVLGKADALDDLMTHKQVSRLRLPCHRKVAHVAHRVLDRRGPLGSEASSPAEGARPADARQTATACQPGDLAMRGICYTLSPCSPALRWSWSTPASSIKSSEGIPLCTRSVSAFGVDFMRPSSSVWPSILRTADRPPQATGVCL